MKIKNIEIENFRGIRRAEIRDIKSIVVIAGANGSGKSCILDALRLLKSVYGGYQQNEYHQWFGEFQINFSADPKSFERLLNDKTKELRITVDFEFAQEEKDFIRSNAHSLVEQSIWRQVVPEIGWSSIRAASLTAQYRVNKEEVEERVKNETAEILNELLKQTVSGQMTMAPGMAPSFENSKLLEIAFSAFAPGKIGIIDYHGPHRLFSREQVANINVDLNSIKEQRKQSSIYNYNAKYSNVKSEMAALYVREAIAKQSGVSLGDQEEVTATLQELFKTFFPDKSFSGPRPNPDGSLDFPVIVGGHEEHDLDELSSGEKEILYGYLRLRNSAPKHSIVLMDEPELHLNPGLTRHLPGFYFKHLALAQSNQVWLITHSDAMLRESVGNPEYSVFHMAPSSYKRETTNQLREVTIKKDLDELLVDLVGDLAAYNPDAKVVIFEGSEETEFDVRMTTELFPAFAAKVTCISGSNKQRVKDVYSILERMSDGGAVNGKVFAITDADADMQLGHGIGQNTFQWDRYHIENYLLDAEILAKVLGDLKGPGSGISKDQAEEYLQAAAAETLTPLVVHKVQSIVNDSCVKALSIRIDPRSTNVAPDLAKSLQASIDRMQVLQAGKLSLRSIEEQYENARRSYLDDLSTGRWRFTFRGRDILKQIAAQHAQEVKYIGLRNLLLAGMRDTGVRPDGMEAQLNRILLSKNS
ncbi:MAG: AAA family ATPase [Cyanobacteria bacterium]|nr:AAA family ATPase [Cyanobacteriota bacterium]